MKSNLISVAVTTHKRPDYLKDCLDSILNQTLLPNELVISEDGEDFNTRGLINQYIIDFPQVNIHHIVNKIPLGQLANRRQAIKATTGEYVAMLDDDDIWNDRFWKQLMGHCLQRIADSVRAIIYLWIIKECSSSAVI